MTIYKVLSDDNYSELFPDVVSMVQKLNNLHEFMDADRNLKPKRPHWAIHEGIVEGKQPLAQISMPHLRQLMLSDAAKTAIGEEISSYGEFLPVTYKGANWHLFNLLNPIEADQESSILNKHEEVESISFKDKDVDGQILWSSPFGNHSEIYCSQRFVDLVESSSLKGVRFQQI
ncbi:MAG: hypothetical protein ACR2PX_28655 [Endozoicomonas sp.]|uniref:hypothetical protein n=1 Tax=Endozoicomonas sp. TaxID=1892382 RepID=UPI003D9BA9E9